MDIASKSGSASTSTASPQAFGRIETAAAYRLVEAAESLEEAGMPDRRTRIGAGPDHHLLLATAQLQPERERQRDRHACSERGDDPARKERALSHARRPARTRSALRSFCGRLR